MAGSTLTAVVAGLVGLLCAIVAAAAWRVLVVTGNRAIGFVVAGFSVLALKGVAKSVALATAGSGEEGWLELAFSLADLVAVGLIAWPLVLARVGPGARA